MDMLMIGAILALWKVTGAPWSVAPAWKLLCLIIGAGALPGRPAGQRVGAELGAEWDKMNRADYQQVRLNCRDYGVMLALTSAAGLRSA